MTVLDNLRQMLVDVDAAMAAEGISDRDRDRVLNRLTYGDAEGPDRRYDAPTGTPLLEPHDVFTENGCYIRTVPFDAAVVRPLQDAGWIRPFVADEPQWSPFRSWLSEPIRPHPSYRVEKAALDVWIDELRRKWRLVTSEHGTEGLTWPVDPATVEWPALAEPVTVTDLGGAR